MDVGRLIEYENGQIDEITMIELFQELIDTGIVWELQGHYGRTAAALIKAGFCGFTDQQEALVGLREITKPEDNAIYETHSINDEPKTIEDIYDEIGLSKSPDKHDRSVF